MKKSKFLIFALIFALILSLTACGAAPGQAPETNSDQPGEAPIEQEAEDSNQETDPVPGTGLPGDSEEDPAEAEDPVEVNDPAEPETDEAYFVDLQFRTKKQLDEHFEKHGIDMGFETAEEYKHAANLVIHNPAVLHKTEKEDGDDVYYLEETNEFVVVSTDGYIRTYFWPDAGKKYFDKQ